MGSDTNTLCAYCAQLRAFPPDRANAGWGTCISCGEEAPLVATVTTSERPGPTRLVWADATPLIGVF